MHLSLKKTKVACRPRLYLQTPAGPAALAPTERAVELAGPWEGEVHVLTDHTDITRLDISLVPLSKSSTIAIDYGEPKPAQQTRA
jgi:hypothetical protein